MHTIKGGWVGQTFALATSNDSVGRKSRIRRSKEERKTMVESFIKKYQKSNNGNFPSLNLTHKEVGGSFYTVRELVREIIQENRVLGPPKLFSEEDNSAFLEQHPVGSISFDPQNGLSLSDKTHAEAPTAYDQDQITSREHISYSSPQFHGPDPVELDNKRIINGLSEADVKEGGSEPSMRHSAPIHYKDSSKDDVSYAAEPFPHSNGKKCVDDQIVNGSYTFEKEQESDEPTIKNTIPIHHDSTSETSVLSSGMLPGQGSQRLSDELIVDKSIQINAKTKSVTYTEAVVKEILDREKDGVSKLETPEAVISHKKPEVVVETFPLRPVSKTIHDMDGEDSKLNGVSGTLEEKASQHEEIIFTKSSSDLINGKVEENLPPLESSDFSTTAEATTPNGNIVQDVEAKDSLPEGTKASDSPKQSVLKETTAVRRKAYLQDNGSFQKESNPMLDRINLETWGGTSKKSPDPNPLLTLLKGCISAFVKFWTE